MLRVVVPFVAPQALAFLLVFAGIQVVELRQEEGSAGVAWGDRVHSSPEELRAWLAERGVKYEVWAQRHPHAAVQLERATAPAGPGHRLGALPGGERTLVVGAGALLLAVSAAATATAALRLARRRVASVASRRALLRTRGPGPSARALASASRSTAVSAVAALGRARRTLAGVSLPGAGHDSSMPLAGVTNGSSLAHVWYRRRLDIVLWTAGVASSVLIGLLTVRLLA